jgi:hypothetical protein
LADVEWIDEASWKCGFQCFMMIQVYIGSVLKESLTKWIEVMKVKFIGVLLLLFMLGGMVTVQAQQVQTLFDGDVSHGGFGGPVVKFSDISGDLGVWVGGRGGWIINLDREHAFSLGGGGYALVTEHSVPDPDFRDGDADYYALTGYGGVEIEYTNRSYRIVHFTVSSLIGGGGLMMREHDFSDVDNHYDHYFVFEPGVNLEVNITHFFRAAVGIGYRMTSGIGTAGFTDGDFSGLNGNLTFKFGRFL